MEGIKTFRIFSLAVSILAVVVLITSMAVPGWIILKMKIPTGLMAGMGGPSSSNSFADSGISSQYPRTTNAPSFDFNDYMGSTGRVKRSMDMGMSQLGQAMQMTITASVGIWTSYTCIESTLMTKCTTQSLYDVLREMAGGDNMTAQGLDAFFGNMDSLRALMPMGLLLTIAGLILVCLFIRKTPASNKSNIGLLAAGSFASAALMVFAAMATMGQQNQMLKSSIDMMKKVSQGTEGFDMDISFPYALLIAGFAGVLCVVLHLVLVVWLVKKPQNGDGSGDWHEFNNQSADA